MSRAEVSTSDLPVGVMPARIVGVSLFRTRWFVTLTLRVEAQGDELVIFGTRRTLYRILVSLGYRGMERGLIPGLRLDLPCEVDVAWDYSHFYRFIVRVSPL